MTRRPGPDEELAFNLRVGAAVREAREERGLTLDQLAVISGLSPNFLQRLETGASGCSLDVALRLARALAVSVDRFSPSAVTRRRR